eukprot:776680_1
MALPPKAGMKSVTIFDKCSDLQKLFGPGTSIKKALKLRFNGLPLHELIYYHSYQSKESVIVSLAKARNGTIDIRRELHHGTHRSRRHPSGEHQDCLGMTPLHVLTCSTSHDLELYRFLIEKYPEDLITQDRWGALPILYAVWGDAPQDIM